jgi:hypothetical protein
MDQEKIAFSGELMLAGWNETHTGGAKVVFWLPAASDLDAFRHMTVRKGNTAGQRFMAVLVEIGDDEHPKDRDRPPQPLLQSALALCRSELFVQFTRKYETPYSSDTGEQHAANVIRRFCHIDSRKELDTNSDAAQSFSRLMAIYRGWCMKTAAERL